MKKVKEDLKNLKIVQGRDKLFALHVANPQNYIVPDYF